MTKFGDKLLLALRELSDGKIGRVSVPVVSAKQSPLRPTRWCCTLQCGHDVWVTSKRKPRVKLLACERCREVISS